VGKWIARKKTPPEYGESEGPMMVACQWNRSSPIGPAEHEDGGSRPKSVSSLLILFNAIANVVCVVVWEWEVVWCRVYNLEGAVR